MDDQTASPRFRLLRVEGNTAQARAVTISVHGTFEAAIGAAAELPDQPSAEWRPGQVDGVWTQIDGSGFGFVLHRLDAQGPP